METLILNKAQTDFLEVQLSKLITRNDYHLIFDFLVGTVMSDCNSINVDRRLKHELDLVLQIAKENEYFELCANINSLLKTAK
jgi:hypothetical protein